MRPDPIRWPGVAGTTNTRAEGWLARTRRQAICSDLAAFHHQGNMRGVLQQSHVAERVAGDDDEIGELALFDRADISFEPKALRRRPRHETSPGDPAPGPPRPAPASRRD